MRLHARLSARLAQIYAVVVGQVGENKPLNKKLRILRRIEYPS